MICFIVVFVIIVVKDRGLPFFLEGGEGGAPLTCHTQRSLEVKAARERGIFGGI